MKLFVIYKIWRSFDKRSTNMCELMYSTVVWLHADYAMHMNLVNVGHFVTIIKAFNRCL